MYSGAQNLAPFQCGAARGGGLQPDAQEEPPKGMAAIKYYRSQCRDEGSKSLSPEEQALWEEPLEAEGDGMEDPTVFVASLLVDAEALVEAGGRMQSGLGRVEVRKVVFREA